VCVPARDEADRLPALLEALALQTTPHPVPVVIALNNTLDTSAEVIDHFARDAGDRLAITVDDHTFPPELAHAGAARRRALQLGAARLSGQSGAVLLTTDADCRPPPEWIVSNLDAIGAGADIVGGRLVIDDAEPLVGAAARLRQLWDLYWHQVRAVEDAYDPNPTDPAPRHGDHTGASLAITLEMHERVGGVPCVPVGEDRALVAAAMALGARLIHPASVWMRTSARRDGRAVGGMADAIGQLHDQAESGVMPMVPDLGQWRDLACWRRTVRQSPRGAARLVQLEQARPGMTNNRRLDQVVGEPCPPQ
jgi:hypothetical protein